MQVFWILNHKFFRESSNLIYTTFSSASLASLFITEKHPHIAANYISVSRLLLKLMIIHFYCSLTISFRSTQQDTTPLCTSACFGSLFCFCFCCCCQRSSSYFIALLKRGEKTNCGRKNVIIIKRKLKFFSMFNYHPSFEKRTRRIASEREWGWKKY